MSSNFSKIIPLARLVRAHGFPKSGVVCLKADLFSRGGELFRSRLFVFIAPGAHPEQFTRVDVAEACSPMGGGWGHANGLLLRFPEGKEPPIGSIVGLPREDFPVLKEGEFYVCDVIGIGIHNEHDAQVGIVTAYFDVGPRSTNLVGKTPDGKLFEFPVEWVDGKNSPRNPDGTLLHVKVPNVEEWITLDPRTGNDE